MSCITHESVMYTKFDFQFAYKTFTHIVLYLYVYMRYLSFVKTEMIPSYSQALLSHPKHLNNNPVRRLVTKTSLRRMARHWDDDGFFCSDFRIWLGCFLKASLVNVFFLKQFEESCCKLCFLKFQIHGESSFPVAIKEFLFIANFLLEAKLLVFGDFFHSESGQP